MERILRKPVESRRAYTHRRNTLAWGMILALVFAAAVVALMLG